MQVDITNLSIPATFTSDNSSNGNAVYAANALFRVILYSDSYAASLTQTTARRRLMADARPSALRALAPIRRPEPASLATAMTAVAGWPAQHVRLDAAIVGPARQLSHLRWQRRSLLAAASAFQDILQTKLQLVAEAFPVIVQCNRSAMMDNFFATGDLPQGLSSNCSTPITEAATASSYTLDNYLQAVSSRGSLTAEEGPFLAQLLPISSRARPCSPPAVRWPVHHCSAATLSCTAPLCTCLLHA